MVIVEVGEDALRMGIRRQTRACVGLAIVAAVLWSSGCSQVLPPLSDSSELPSGRTPVVFVPGVTGVALSDGATGEYVWGKGRNLIRPHDRGHGTARSMTTSHPGPKILAADVILDLKLFGLVRFGVYQRLVDLFRQNGYRLGRLEQPRPTDDFFLFSYDWRQDNVSSAARLAEQLEAVRRVRGLEALQFNLICQSNGAHVCRYFTKYGSLGLEDAESGRDREPSGSTVENLILVGASNGGSIRVLRELDRGRKYVEVIGRRWAPETLFTFVSLYQDLPAYTEDLFVDEKGRAVAVDLYDAETWRRYQWSIYRQETEQRMNRKAQPPWLGTALERQEFLVGALERARRFQRLLHRDVGDVSATRYHLITNMRNETASRAVLVWEKGQWRTRFGDDRSVRRNPALRLAVVEAGDGHATAESQRWLSGQELQRLGGNHTEVEGSHRRMILQEATHEQILKILGEKDQPGL